MYTLCNTEWYSMYTLRNIECTVCIHYVTLRLQYVTLRNTDCTVCKHYVILIVQ